MSKDIDDLEAIYQAYPRHVAKAAAIKAIVKAIEVIRKRGEAEPAAWLLAQVQAYAASPAGNNGVYTPYPATWFNRASFDDDPAEWRRSDAAKGVNRGCPAKPGKYDHFPGKRS